MGKRTSLLFKGGLLLCVVFSMADIRADIVTPDHAAAGDDIRCLPEVIIHTRPSPWSICLNTLDPGPDSCVEISIDGSKLFGALLHFSRTDSSGWRYRGMTFPENGNPQVDIRIELRDGADGALMQAHFYPHDQPDSSMIPPHLLIEHDLPALPDTAKPDINLSLHRIVTDCHPKPWKVIVEERHYTYPPGFRRDPVLNYPEFSMFHYGKSVRMPTARSLENRAQLYIYWHTSLAPLKFEDSEALWEKEAVVNKFRKTPQPKPEKPKKPPRVTFKPLH